MIEREYAFEPPLLQQLDEVLKAKVPRYVGEVASDSSWATTKCSSLTWTWCMVKNQHRKSRAQSGKNMKRLAQQEGQSGLKKRETLDAIRP